MKQGKVVHKFPGSNTAEGFHSFYAENLRKMNRVYILKGGPGTGKSSLMRKIGTEMAAAGLQVELWQCSSDNSSLDGVVLPELKIAMVDGTAPHTVDPVYPGVVEKIINLGEYWDAARLLEHKDEIVALTGEISAGFGRAYDALRVYLKRYEQGPGSFSYSMDGLLATADELINRILRPDAPRVSHFFASAITPQGWVGYGQELTEGLKRYLIAGGNLQAVHTLIGAVAEAAVACGHEAEIYHSSIDPQYYEILCLPGAGAAVLDANAPDIERREGDVLLELADIAGNDEELSVAMNVAINHIARAKSLHNDLEAYYIEAMDFVALNKMCDEIIAEIKELAGE